jgi:hypothetical protein
MYHPQQQPKTPQTALPRVLKCFSKLTLFFEICSLADIIIHGEAEVVHTHTGLPGQCGGVNGEPIPLTSRHESRRGCVLCLFFVIFYHNFCCLDRPGLGTTHVTAPCRLHQPDLTIALAGTGTAVARNPKLVPSDG